MVNGLYTAENNIQHTFDCPIRSVGLHPDFGKRGNRQYVIGVGEKLTLFEKGWLRNKSTVIHSGEGFVRSIKWKGNFIAWANSQVSLSLLSIYCNISSDYLYLEFL